MGLRIVVGILILGYALRFTRNIYRTMKRSQPGIESTYLFGMKADIEARPLPRANRIVYFYGWQVVIGGLAVPLWFSYVAAFFAVVLALMVWRENLG